MANHGNDVIVVQLFSRARILEKLQQKVTSKTVNVIIKKRRLTAIFHDLNFYMRLTESGKSSFLHTSHSFQVCLGCESTFVSGRLKQEPKKSSALATLNVLNR